MFCVFSFLLLFFVCVFVKRLFRFHFFALKPFKLQVHLQQMDDILKLILLLLEGNMVSQIGSKASSAVHVVVISAVSIKSKQYNSSDLF